VRVHRRFFQQLIHVSRFIFRTFSFVFPILPALRRLVRPYFVIANAARVCLLYLYNYYFDLLTSGKLVTSLLRCILVARSLARRPRFVGCDDEKETPSGRRPEDDEERGKINNAKKGEGRKDGRALRRSRSLAYSSILY